MSGFNLISIANTAIFREILHNISQNSPTLSIEKTAQALTFSSTSTSELCHVCIVFERKFFNKWDDRVAGPFEIDAKTIYDISNSIQPKSLVKMTLYHQRICFEITDSILKKIALSDLERASTIYKPVEIDVETTIVIRSAPFLTTIKELCNLLDEAQLLIKKESNQIVFSGKRSGLTVEMSPERIGNFSCENTICAEFPVKLFLRLSPLLKNFEEINLRFAPKAPLIMDAVNDKWRLSFVVSKIDKLQNK